MMFPRKYPNRKSMEADTELWDNHPLLVSYQNFYDATSGQLVSRIATFHRRVEEWDDISCNWVMVDLFDSSLEPAKPTPISNEASHP